MCYASDQYHIASESGGFDEALLDKLLAPYVGQVLRRDTIAEDGTEPSCYLVVIEKK